MKVTYDPEVDVLTILLSSALVEESDESNPGVILDYDKAGNVVGMEILDASRRTDSPQTMEYAITMPNRRNPTPLAVRESSTAEYGSERAVKAKRRTRAKKGGQHGQD